LTHALLIGDNANHSQLESASQRMKHEKIMTDLSSLATGEMAHITGIHAPNDVRQRLQAMGLRTGREALVIRRTRLGPMQIRIGSVDLIIRRRDAARIAIATKQ
jgi:Fe2+ transport system protein FeoA